MDRWLLKISVWAVTGSEFYLWVGQHLFTLDQYLYLAVFVLSR